MKKIKNLALEEIKNDMSLTKSISITDHTVIKNPYFIDFIKESSAHIQDHMDLVDMFIDEKIDPDNIFFTYDVMTAMIDGKLERKNNIFKEINGRSMNEVEFLKEEEILTRPIKGEKRAFLNNRKTKFINIGTNQPS